jgi:hypothetical protein
MFLSLLFTPWTLLALPLLFFILPYMRNWSIQDVPGPFLAKFSNLWLLIECRLCRRYLTVHKAHAKYGKLVRIQPNQVSIADPDAIPIVYGHGTGFLKAYESLVKYVDHKLTMQKVTTMTLSCQFSVVSSTPEIVLSTLASARLSLTLSVPRALVNLSSTCTTTSRCSPPNGTSSASRLAAASTAWTA